MNSIGERDWEIYNYDNIGGSTEYDNLLINKDIDNYFNNIISKPVVQTNTSIIKSNYNLNKFYNDYIEHNLIFIVVLVGIIIFLVIRHYVKDFDTFDADNNKEESDKSTTKRNCIKKYKKQNERIKNKSKKLEIERNKLINYKIELDKEKQQILTIIDELSNMNEYENNINQYNQYNQQNQNNQNNLVYLNEDINAIYTHNYNDNQLKFSNQTNNIHTMAHNDNGTNIIYENDNVSNFYDINKSQNKKINEIDGLYIDPPFM